MVGKSFSAKAVIELISNTKTKINKAVKTDDIFILTDVATDNSYRSPFIYKGLAEEIRSIPVIGLRNIFFPFYHKCLLNDFAKNIICSYFETVAYSFAKLYISAIKDYNI